MLQFKIQSTENRIHVYPAAYNIFMKNPLHNHYNLPREHNFPNGIYGIYGERVVFHLSRGLFIVEYMGSYFPILFASFSRITSTYLLYAEFGAPSLAKIRQGVPEKVKFYL